MTPPWMETAEQLVGKINEYKGKKNNPIIMDWAKRLEGTKVDKTYYADSVPWCGLFVAHCVSHNGIAPVKDPLWALNWAKFGYKVKPAYGAILSFKRNGGGHVGFYVGESGNYYKVLGGNQSDAVNVKLIEKSRCVAVTWPTGFEKFYGKGKGKNYSNVSKSTSEA